MSLGSSASRDGGSRKTAVSRPTHASISARRQRRPASSDGTAIGKVSDATRAASTVMRRASTTVVSYSSSARAICHFRACGSSVSWPRVSSMTSPCAAGGATRSSSVTDATVPRSRMAKRMRPPVSTASKPKCRASVVIEARGLSSAVMV
jgi:hypothetical protein